MSTCTWRSVGLFAVYACRRDIIIIIFLTVLCDLDTTPPKERIKDMLKDFYSAGFVPGAIVYFSYDVPKG